MQVKDLLEIKGKTVYTIGIHDSLRLALEKMMKNQVGSLVVVDQDQQVKGIITERDLLRKCVFEEKDPHREAVQDHFTRQLLIISPDDALTTAMESMTRNRIRHLPVVRENSLDGIISIGDVVKAQLTEFKTENLYLKDYITAKYPG